MIIAHSELQWSCIARCEAHGSHLPCLLLTKWVALQNYSRKRDNAYCLNHWSDIFGATRWFEALTRNSLNSSRWQGSSISVRVLKAVAALARQNSWTYEILKIFVACLLHVSCILLPKLRRFAQVGSWMKDVANSGWCADVVDFLQGMALCRLCTDGLWFPGTTISAPSSPARFLLSTLNERAFRYGGKGVQQGSWSFNMF